MANAYGNKKNGYTGKCLQMISGNSSKAKLLFPHNKIDRDIYKINKERNIKSLFEIQFNNEIIATHLTKSTCLEFNVHEISQFWISRINKHMDDINV